MHRSVCPIQCQPWVRPPLQGGPVGQEVAVVEAAVEDLEGVEGAMAASDSCQTRISQRWVALRVEFQTLAAESGRIQTVS